MAALRSLTHEVAGWQLEHERRVKHRYACSLCGLDRDDCVCDLERRENYAGSSDDDAGYE